MEAEKTVIGDVALIPLIVALIQFLKSLAPDSTPGNVWKVLAFVLGIIGQTTVFIIARGFPQNWDFSTWAVVIVSGLWFALLATQSYDSVIKPRLTTQNQ